MAETIKMGCKKEGSNQQIKFLNHLWCSKKWSSKQISNQGEIRRNRQWNGYRVTATGTRTSPGDGAATKADVLWRRGIRVMAACPLPKCANGPTQNTKTKSEWKMNISNFQKYYGVSTWLPTFRSSTVPSYSRLSGLSYYTVSPCKMNAPCPSEASAITRYSLSPQTTWIVISTADRTSNFAISMVELHTSITLFSSYVTSE